MKTTHASEHSEETAESYVLAGRNEDGAWHLVAAETPAEGESVDDVKTYLQTMAHASSRNFVELQIFTASEFAEHTEDSTSVAA
jgi:hypothetical protein